jgi:hypothetical protein
MNIWATAQAMGFFNETNKISKTKLLLFFTSGGTCLFDIDHSALWGSEYPVCTPDTQELFLSGTHMLHTQHSAVQALPGRV